MEHNAQQKIGGIELLINNLELFPFELLEYAILNLDPIVVDTLFTRHCWRQTSHLYVYLTFAEAWPINIIQAQQVLIRLYGHFAAIQRTAQDYSRNLTILLPNSVRLYLISDITHAFAYSTEILNQWNERRQENNLPSLLLEKIEEEHIHKLSKSLGEANLPTDYTPYEFNYKSFNCVSLAGTFDRLHFDHKMLITLGTLVAKKKLVVAVLTVLGGKKHQELIESIETRNEGVKRFLDIIDTTIAEKDIQIVTRCPNSDGCRLMNDPEIEAAVVENNEEGINGINHVNGLRVSKFNLKSLTIVWKHSCRIISSTDLREWIARKSSGTKKASAEHGRK